MTSSQQPIQTELIEVPFVGENPGTCILTAWFADVGDFVCKNDMLAEITVDAIAVTLHATHAGYLKEIHRNINEEVSIGETIGVLALKSPGHSS